MADLELGPSSLRGYAGVDMHIARVVIAPNHKWRQGESNNSRLAHAAVTLTKTPPSLPEQSASG